MFLWLSFQSIFSFDKTNRASTGVVETFEADVRAKDRARVTEILNSRWYIKPDIVQKNILSEGSYGVAFKIVTRSGDQMVMKSSKKSGPFASSDFVRELSVLERFAELERAAERIVKLVGANMDDGFNIFVKYYEKNDLVSFVRMHGRRLSVYHKRRMSSDILTMLQELRSHKIIHRDIKAENIAVTKDLRCVLLDFGMAVEFNPVAHDLSGRFVTTVHTRSPEVAVGIYRYSYDADTFSAGCVLWELLTSGERLLSNVSHRRFRAIGGQAQFIFDSIYEHFGTAARVINNQRPIGSSLKKLHTMILKKPKRQRMLEHNFYRVVKKRTVNKMMQPFSESTMIRACAMVRSLLWWFPYERIVIRNCKNWKVKIAFLDHFLPPISADLLHESKMKLFASCCDVSDLVVAKRVSATSMTKRKKKLRCGSKRKINKRQNKRKKGFRSSLNEQYKP